MVLQYTIYVNKFTILKIMVNKFTNIKERVVQIARKQSISQERFYHSIGMTSASFRGKAKDSPLNSNAIANIITNYPEVDLHWLVTGEEEEPPKQVVNEPGLVYEAASKICEEKDEMIAMLKNQVEDLKADKADLKRLLGLKEDS
jgi:hypothetical protein